jgi:hypothetical protein
MSARYCRPSSMCPRSTEFFQPGLRLSHHPAPGTRHWALVCSFV